MGPWLAVAALVACERAPLPGVCPEVQPGELLLSEIRGPQSGPSADVQWIELHNTSDHEVALGGLRVTFTALDGEPRGAFFVRDADLVVGPGEYAVLGGGNPALEPYVDYDYTVDWYSTRTNSDGTPVDDDHDGEPDRFVKDLPGAGYVDVLSCGVRVDRVLVRGLPPCGTLFWPEDGDGDHAVSDDWRDDCHMDPPDNAPGTPGVGNSLAACSAEEVMAACS